MEMGFCRLDGTTEAHNLRVADQAKSVPVKFSGPFVDFEGTLTLILLDESGVVEAVGHTLAC